eukprot:1503146-Amphidinium_carterae.3
MFDALMGAQNRGELQTHQKALPTTRSHQCRSCATQSEFANLEGDGNCSWTVGPWSSCTGRCGPQTRDVACDSGLDADCYAIVPPAKAQVEL